MFRVARRLSSSRRPLDRRARAGRAAPGRLCHRLLAWRRRWIDRSAGRRLRARRQQIRIGWRRLIRRIRHAGQRIDLFPSRRRRRRQTQFLNPPHRFGAVIALGEIVQERFEGFNRVGFLRRIEIQFFEFGQLGFRIVAILARIARQEGADR